MKARPMVCQTWRRIQHSPVAVNRIPPYPTQWDGSKVRRPERPRLPPGPSGWAQLARRGGARKHARAARRRAPDGRPWSLELGEVGGQGRILERPAGGAERGGAPARGCFGLMEASARRRTAASTRRRRRRAGRRPRRRTRPRNRTDGRPQGGQGRGRQIPASQGLPEPARAAQPRTAGYGIAL